MQAGARTSQLKAQGSEGKSEGEDVAIGLADCCQGCLPLPDAENRALHWR